MKEAPKTQLTNAIRRTLCGESPMNQELAMRLLRRLTDQESPPTQPSPEPATPRHEPPPGTLTPRELDVLRHLTEGKTNRQIAEDLHLSLSTVKGHLERIIKKLEVSDRTQAAVKAVELGLADPFRKKGRDP